MVLRRMVVLVAASSILCVIDACASAGSGAGDRADAEHQEAPEPNQENLRQVLKQRPR